jgi:CHAT domain-containing protein
LEERLPSELLDQIRKIDSDYDLALADLFRAISERQVRAIETSQSRIRELRDKKAFLLTEPRYHTDGFETSEYQLQLDFAGVLRTLDPGTVMLSYNVGPEQTDLFAIHPGGTLQATTIPIREEELRKEIEQMNGLLLEARPDASVGALRLAHLDQIARQLYILLIHPVETAIQTSDRVMILPDGPLHSVPWGLLVRPIPDSDQREQYLVEWKPFHIALSASLFSELKARRVSKPPEGPPILAFGDPIYPNTSTSLKELSFERVSRDLGLMPLPGSRREVENILAMFPNGEAYLGSEATEKRAKSTLARAFNIHFAAHAVLDEGLPLNSAIVLSLPPLEKQDSDNGLLQAWEIFEQVHLNANLVVLSACESGLGKELGGEGLIGLTRAFQYAGARSVLASLWKISDRTTAELMVRFYKHLKAGKTKDEALRAAQIELIRGPIEITNEKGEVEKVDASAPYYWAAFQLYGDWQ